MMRGTLSRKEEYSGRGGMQRLGIKLAEWWREYMKWRERGMMVVGLLVEPVNEPERVVLSQIVP